MKRIHVVFKTHLDIGFTDLAAAVVRRYMDELIPRAMDLAEELDPGDGKPRFIWTTGSWLIWKYLRDAAPAERDRLEAAIRRGHIAWHALPFTTHSELLSEELFSFGLTLSEELDRRFERETIAAKMSDVPGHTRGIVSILARHGVKYLHIGVNTASKMPSVPPFFVWRDRRGSELIVNYSRGYGDIAILPGCDEILMLAHTNDNLGPPSREDVVALLRKIGERFPDAEVRASTLDRFARGIAAERDRLPVVEEEIGDTWVHGTASDPGKVARMRLLERLRARWISQGRLQPGSEEWRGLSEQLLLVAEHTWGADIKTHLADNLRYGNREFAKARTEPAYLFCEESWREQRGYLDRALDAVAPALAGEARAELEKLAPVRPVDLAGQEIEPGREYETGAFRAVFGENGAIDDLSDRSRRQWARAGSPLALFRYEAFGAAEIDRWCREYLEITQRTREWAFADFGKPGLDLVDPSPTHQIFIPVVSSLRLAHSPGLDTVTALMRFPEVAYTDYGAPREAILVYRFARDPGPDGASLIEVTLSWFDKTATRLPEASWLTFSPLVENPNRVSFAKLSEIVSPLDVVSNGNRALHAIDGTVRYHGADGSFALTSLDAPVVAPGAPRLLTFEDSFADPRGGMHFLLHNNVWGTNFPQWYGEDAQFRFSLSLRSHTPVE